MSEDIVNKRKRQNIFLAYTPYHCLLLIGKAIKECAADGNIIFIIADFDCADKLADCLRQWKESPFKEVVLLDGKKAAQAHAHERFARLHAYLLERKQGIFLANYTRHNSVSGVYLCNDQRTQSQYVLREVSRNRGMHCDFLEDGSYIYQSLVVQPLNMRSVFISKMVYGLWWKDVTVLALNKAIRHIYAAFPPVIREELRQKSVRQMNPDFLTALSGTSFLTKYAEAMSLKMNGGCEVLYIAPHSEFYERHPAYKFSIKSIISFLVENNIKLTVKYHPREPKPDYLGLADLGDVTLIPHSFPVEIFYLKSLGDIKLILGDVSTALFTAKIIFKSKAIISLAKLIQCQDKYFIGVAEAVGLIVPTDIESVKENLKSACLTYSVPSVH